MSRCIPAVLTIAGSDSGGGAGIQADLRTFNALGVYGCSAVTAVTSQNPDEVRSVYVLPASEVVCQIETVLDVMPIRVVKTGMLANSKIIGSAAKIVAERKLELIIDPVMVSTSGAELLDKSAVKTMKEELFPLATWITPNIPEAELICNTKIRSLDDLAGAAVMLYEQYGCNVILKSGHLIDNAKAEDIVCCNGKLYILRSPRLAVSGNTAHGTGCTLSSALAANFALGKCWREAVSDAKTFVYGSLVEQMELRKDFFQMYPPSGEYTDKIILKEYSALD